VVNPSGGLISKGHPLGATGLAQCSELTWQLRADADARQVEGAELALQHNIGSAESASSASTGRCRLMAAEARPIAGRVRRDHRRRTRIGKATARALAARGARVAIGDLDADLAAETASQLGGGAIATELDVTDRASFRRSSNEGRARARAHRRAREQRWDHGPSARFLDESDETAIRQIDINIHGLCLRDEDRCARMSNAAAATSSTSRRSPEGRLPGRRDLLRTSTRSRYQRGRARRAGRDRHRDDRRHALVVNTELISGAATPREPEIAEPEDVAEAIVRGARTPEIRGVRPGRRFGRINRS